MIDQPTKNINYLEKLKQAQREHVQEYQGSYMSEAMDALDKIELGKMSNDDLFKLAERLYEVNESATTLLEKRNNDRTTQENRKTDAPSASTDEDAEEG